MADICIGGGITGLTTAYRLMNDHTVMVLESLKQAAGYKVMPMKAVSQSMKHQTAGLILSQGF